MLTRLALLIVLVLATGAFAPLSSGPVIVLLGKPYPQYQQVSSAFSAEWKKATGTEPVLTPFPGDEPTLARLLARRPATMVCLGEAPTAWAIRQTDNFNLGFTMVVKPERVQTLRGDSPQKKRKLLAISIEVPLQQQLELTLQVVPQWRRIGVITLDPALRDTVAEMRRICNARGVQLTHVELASTSELPDKLDRVLPHIDLLWSLPDSNVLQPSLAQHIIGQCAARRVALFGVSSTFVKAGATLSIERDYHEIGRMLAQQCLNAGWQTESQDNWAVFSPNNLVLSANQLSLQSLGIAMQQPASHVSIVRY